MKDSPLLFNNANYNKIINSKINKNYSNNDLLLNISILLGFLLMGGIFLLYRYNHKISEEKITVEEEINAEEENEIELEKDDLSKINENVKNIKIEEKMENKINNDKWIKIKEENKKTEHLNNCYFEDDNIDNKFYSLI